MQANVIDGGKVAADAILYSNSRPGLIDYLNNQLHSLKDYAYTLGNNFVNMATNIYNHYNSNENIILAKSIVNNNYTIDNNAIYTITPNNIATTNSIMQRYIYSNPTVSTMCNRGLLYGYDHMFIDNQPGAIGKDRIDYQRVMDGVVNLEEESPVIPYYTTTSEEEDLHYLDRLAILDSWNTVVDLISNGIDPTDLNNL